MKELEQSLAHPDAVKDMRLLAEDLFSHLCSALCEEEGFQDEQRAEAARYVVSRIQSLVTEL